MKFGKIVVLLMTAVLMAGALFVWSKEPGAEDVLRVTLTVPGGTEQIRVRDFGRGEYALCLPGFGEPDIAQTDKAVTVTASQNVPALFVDVRSGSMDHIHQEKGNSEAGSLRLYQADGSLDYAGSFDVLEGRGSSTWEREKKPYDLELSAEADLLGMGAAKRWVLLANAMDPSQLRNKIVYDFARTLGLPYTPECQWVNLYLNGEYTGLYLLCERNEIHPQRVNLTGDACFLVSKEWEWRMEAQKQAYVQLDSRAALRLRDTNMTPEAVKAVFQSAENAILAEDGMDPVTGKHWRELIDVDSWAMKYLIEEVFGNVDGGTLSQYFYYDGGKIYAGPIWDYDLTMGNVVAYPHPVANMFYVNRERVYATRWYPALYEDPEFFGRMVELYTTRFRPLLAVLVETGVDVYGNAIIYAAYADMLRWGSGFPAGEMAYVKEYLIQRMAFLDSIWVRGEDYATVMVQLADDTLLRYEVKPGETLPQLPSYESTETWIVHGWHNKVTEEPFDIAGPIYEDTEIYLKHSTLAEGAQP